MKKAQVRLYVLCFAILGGLLILSCAPGPQNTNQNSSTGNQNMANGTDESAFGAMSTPCSADDIRGRMNQIAEKYSSIKKQRDGVDHSANLKYFKYDVIEDGEWKVLVIEGGLSDGTKDTSMGNAELMEWMVRDVDQMVKKNCAFKTVFVKAGTLEAVKSGGLKREEIEGFEWSACEWPEVACPGGYCAQVCAKRSPTPALSPSPVASPSPTATANINNGA